MRQNIPLLWFTLVELIVVITIVGILSTVGFVSYSGYLTWARDSNRISQLTKISDSLQVYSASKTLPLPDDAINITASGTTTSETIAYQGYIWVDVLETIDYTNGWQDPKDDIYYTYYLTKDRKSLQLLALMEEEQSVTYSSPNNNLKIADLLTRETNAATYEDRFPKVYGRKLWVLTQIDTNTPAQEVTLNITNGYLDIVNEPTQYIAHITDEINDKIEWTGTQLRAMIQNGSCKRIKQTGWANGNGTYTINPGWSWEILAYCEMETQGWWWTLIARSYPSSTIAFGTATWDVSTDSAAYVIGAVTNFAYDEAMMTSYDTGKNITWSNVANVTPPIANFTDGTHTLATAWISWGTLTWHGMFFIK